MSSHETYFKKCYDTFLSKGMNKNFAYFLAKHAERELYPPQYVCVISDSVGEDRREFYDKVECINYAELLDGIAYQYTKDWAGQHIIDKAVSLYESKKKSHVVC